MNIRLLDKKDWPSFKALRLEALHMHPEAFGSSYEEEAILSGDAFEKNFNKSNIFGAFQEKQLVGCAGFLYIIHLKWRIGVWFLACIQNLSIEALVLEMLF